MYHSTRKGSLRHSRAQSQILLDEPRTEVHIDLYQWRIADGREAVDLTGLDHKNISCSAFERFTVDRPHSSSFPDELNLIIRMPMRPRPRSWLSMEEEHRDIGPTLFRPHELMRTTHKRQTLLPHVMHLLTPPLKVG